MSAQTAPDGLPLPRRYGAVATVALGIMLAVLDGAIANVALPSISRDLLASPAESIWIINAYQIAIITSLLSLSFIGDMVGYRRVYQYGLTLFILTSVLCALSASLEMLTLARVLQGFGAAAIMSVNTALIRVIYPKSLLGRGIALNALVVAVSAAAGPTVAAAILAVASWKWLFLVNVPIGLASLALSLKYLPENRRQNTSRFDFISAVLNALFFGLLLASLSGFAQGVSHHVILTEVIALLMVGVVFVKRQMTMAVPLLPLDLLRIPVFTLSLCTSICSFGAQMLAMVSLPFYLQTILSKSEVETGLLLTPWPIAIIFISPIAGKLIGKIHAGILGCVGLTIFAAGLLCLALLPYNPSDAFIVSAMLLCGIGFGFFQSPNNHTIISSAPPNRSGGASGMLGTARLLGQSSGTALVALMLNMLGKHGTRGALMLAVVFATTGALISVSRVRQTRNAVAN